MAGGDGGLFHFDESFVNLFRHRRAGSSPGSSAIDHDDDRIARVFVRPIGIEPSDVRHLARRRLDLRGPGFAGDAEIAELGRASRVMEGGISAALASRAVRRMLRVCEHGMANYFQITRIDGDSIAQTARALKLYFIPCFRRARIA